MQSSILILASQAASPQTGDNANVMLYVVLGIIAIVLVLILTFKDKIFKPKNEKAEEKKAAEKKSNEATETAEKKSEDE